MRKTPDEPALFKRCDKTVDAGFGRQVQRILHLVKGWRNAGFLNALIDEEQQFLLFTSQHG